MNVQLIIRGFCSRYVTPGSLMCVSASTLARVHLKLHQKFCVSICFHFLQIPGLKNHGNTERFNLK